MITVIQPQQRFIRCEANSDIGVLRLIDK
jgi:hypothetical protein